jgi:hypothetical protein
VQQTHESDFFTQAHIFKEYVTSLVESPEETFDHLLNPEAFVSQPFSILTVV